MRIFLGRYTERLEMLDQERLRLEWFDTHDAVSEFTDEARVYVR